LNGGFGPEYFATVTPSQGCQAAFEVVRKHVPRLEEDRPIYDDINTLTRVLKRGEVLNAVEQVVGKLN
jgi:histidine ammonia-lyase